MMVAMVLPIKNTRTSIIVSLLLAQVVGAYRAIWSIHFEDELAGVTLVLLNSAFWSFALAFVVVDLIDAVWMIWLVWPMAIASIALYVGGPFIMKKIWRWFRGIIVEDKLRHLPTARQGPGPGPSRVLDSEIEVVK